jgi:copper oxidase (laccase) domain-containing protein
VGRIASQSLKHLGTTDVIAAIGPCIGPCCFEVGPEVREVFIAQLAETHQAFVPSHNAGKYLADIYLLARLRLKARGVNAVYGGGWCTVTDPRFFSYRRAPRTGRFASLIWLER